MKILTFDPGASNFAYCFAEINELSASNVPSVVDAGKLKVTIRKIVPEQVKAFRLYLRKLLKPVITKGDVVFVERYSLRGGFSGKNSSFNVELYNLMIGILLAVCDGLGATLNFTTASVWKTWANKRSIRCLDEPRTSKFGSNQHERDCIVMMIYQWSALLRKVKKSCTKNR